MRHARSSFALACCLSLAACGSGDSEPAPEPRVARAASLLQGGTYYVGFKLFGDAACTIQSVSVTGPGISAPLSLDCFPGDCWRQAGVLTVSLGSTPPSSPAVYTFQVQDASGTTTMTAAIPCYLASAPTILQPAPGATVTSPVAFRWTGMAGGGWTYTAYSDTGRLFVVDDATSASVALPARTYSQLALDVIGTGGWEPTATNTCGARTLGGPFTVTGP